MERYSEYKDSGVQWLGEIPEHWKIHRAKYMFNKEQRPILKDDEIVTCFRDGEVTLRKNRRISGFTEATDYSHYQHICKGDLVIHQMDAFAGSSGVSDSDGMGTPVLSVCTAKSGDINNFYYAHILRLMGRNGYILSLYRGIRERSSDFRFDTFAKQWLPLPPEHWEMSKISSHFRQRTEKVSDKQYQPLSVSKLGITPQLDNVALSNAEGCSRKLVKKGDYAVNSRSDRKGSCGVSAYNGSVSLITIVLEPFNIDGDYIHYLFRSAPWVEEFYRNGKGIVADLWTTNYQMMKSMYFPVPPISEQRAIVSYINERTEKIDTLTSKLQQEIESIQEYKQRLISDVVTGQIKVC